MIAIQQMVNVFHQEIHSCVCAKWDTLEMEKTAHVIFLVFLLELIFIRGELV